MTSTPTTTEAEPVDRIPNEFPHDKAALWTPAETAAVLRVKPGAVEGLYRSGDLPAVFIGKHKRFHPDDVRGLVAKLRGAAR